jgi:endogenous inhibitor of DNA gyrase (YacG/DUF329 family)
MAGQDPQLQCPVCRRPVAKRVDNPAFPFCSPRCRTIDLGEWLTESYRVPEGEDETERDGVTEAQARGPGLDEDPN